MKSGNANKLNRKSGGSAGGELALSAVEGNLLRAFPCNNCLESSLYEGDTFLTTVKRAMSIKDNLSSESGTVGQRNGVARIARQ